MMYGLEAVSVEAERNHTETREFVASVAMDVVEAIGARLEGRGSTVDAAYLVEIGVARLEVAEVDGALRRGIDVDVRRTLGRMDDLLRRLEGSIVRGAAARVDDAPDGLIV